MLHEKKNPALQLVASSVENLHWPHQVYTLDAANAVSFLCSMTSNNTTRVHINDKSSQIY